MKRSVTILIIGIMAALAAYAGGYFAGTSKPRALMRSETPELAWLRDEFNLSPTEFQRISALHDAYLPGCATRCGQIDAVNAELRALLSTTKTITPEIQRRLAEAATLRVECQTAMWNHFLAVSQAMPPEQGKRYLAWIEDQTFLPEHRMGGHHH